MWTTSAAIPARRLLATAVMTAACLITPAVAAHADGGTTATPMAGCSVSGLTDTYDHSPATVYGGAALSCAAPSFTTMSLRVRLYRSGTLMGVDRCEVPPESGRSCDAAVSVTDHLAGAQSWYSKVDAAWDTGSRSFTTNTIKH